MAFAIAYKGKGAPLAGLLKNLLLAAPSSSSVLRHASIAAVPRARLFSTAGGVPLSRDNTMSDEEFLRYHGRPGTMSPTFFTEACRGWVSKQEKDFVQVKMEMPGMAAEHVKVWRSPKLGLLIRGEDGTQAQDPKRIWYSGRIVPSSDDFDLDKAQAEMKDGVLTVTVPRGSGVKVSMVKVDRAGEESTEIKVLKG